MTAPSIPPSRDASGSHIDDQDRHEEIGRDRQASEPDAEATAEPDRLSDAPPPLHRIIEALLFVGGPPLTAVRAGETIRGLTPAQFIQAIDSLNKDYRRQGRPYSIRPQDQGYVLTLRPRFRPLVDKLYGGPREARLSPQAIDALALIAYRQPATKEEVDSLRGIESGALLRQLVRRGLITVVQRGESGQRDVSYGTTTRFLELFGLASLDDLPQTQDLQML
jgi:segregation and condensation protein B